MDDEVRKIFNKFHNNSDKKILRTELKQMMLALGSKTMSEEANRMMVDIDQNDDGYIDLKKFGEIHIDGGDALELREASEMYDLDKNELISTKKLHAAITSAMTFGDVRMFGDMHNVESREIELELEWISGMVQA